MRSDACRNQSGFLMIAALLMLVALSVTVFMAARIALTSSQMMRNNRIYRDHMYRAQSIISLAVEAHRDKWLDPDSDLFDLNDPDAAYTETGLHLEGGAGDSFFLGSCEIARVEASPKPGALSDEFYRMPHFCPPAVGSGSSGQMTARRYGILAVGTNQRQNGRVVLEAGFTRIF